MREVFPIEAYLDETAGAGNLIAGAIKENSDSLGIKSELRSEQDPASGSRILRFHMRIGIY